MCGRCRHCLAGRRHLCAHAIGLGVEPRRGVRRVRRAADDQRLAPLARASTRRSPRSSTRSATRSTPRSRSRSWARTCSSRGAGPIGLMAIAVVRHAGARFIVVVRSRTPTAARSPSGWARRVAVDPTERDLAEVRPELGMVEGFDVALEMSGNAAALRSAIASMAHGGGVAILGIPTGRDLARRQPDRVQDADPARHLRPRDVRDLVQDDGDAPVRARHPARDHPPVPVSASTRRRSRRPARASRAR